MGFLYMYTLSALRFELYFIHLHEYICIIHITFRERERERKHRCIIITALVSLCHAMKRSCNKNAHVEKHGKRKMQVQSHFANTERVACKSHRIKVHQIEKIGNGVVRSCSSRVINAEIPRPVAALGNPGLLRIMPCSRDSSRLEPTGLPAGQRAKVRNGCERSPGISRSPCPSRLSPPRHN